MTPDALVVTRTPTIRFTREQFVEPGVRVWLFWNGTRAPNGDGVPGGDATIDYGTPIHSSAAGVAMHVRGHGHLYGGAYGEGGFGEPGAALNESMGFGTGPYGVGAYGIGGGWWEWKFPFPLRDGDYRIGVLLGDALGNIQDSGDGVEMMMAVRALPRAARNLRLSTVNDFLRVEWEHSPEFAATE